MKDITRKIHMIIDVLTDNVTDPPMVRDALRLKQLHTACVAENSVLLATSAGCSPRQTELAQRIGWCHDLGRFLQFRQYHTFDDSKSLDHGLLSLKLVKALGLDRDLTPDERGLLWAAILLHNRRSLPTGLPARTRFFAALLRDADRLDIFRIFTEYYRQIPVPGSPLELNYPDTGEITPAVAQSIIAGISPPYELGSSVQDMRLIKLSWVYTLETPGAVELFRACGIVEATRSVLPDTDEVNEILKVIEDRTNRSKKNR